MCPSRLLTAALLVAAGLSSASAADLRTIDRLLPDEPKYNTSTPRYCLLVFGPEAQTRIWLVRDGEVVHVLDSPDGKVARRWRAVKGEYNSFKLGDVWEDGGKVCHKNLIYYQSTQFARVTVTIDGKRQTAGRDRYGKLAFGGSAQEAPVIHFNGPLTLDLFEDQEPLQSNQSVDMTAVVGTHGVGPGTFALFNCSAYPKGAWPTAIIELPAQEGEKATVLNVRLADN